MVGQAAMATLHEAAGTAEVLLPSVLVIDDDPVCRSHCSHMLDELGYRHHSASTAREALELVSAHSNIQIVLADMEMPSMDGFVLVEEARARASGKPIAAIMLTDSISAGLAIRGLHIEAVDLLCKPLDFDAYSAALRRAVRYLAARRISSTESSMLDFGQQLSRLVSVLEGSALEPKPDGRGTDKEITATLRAIIGSRGLRSRFFPSQLFADPAWDILLDLTRAKLEDQEVSVSSVCIAASVPMSTALRWVRQMTDAGLLRRWTDPKDRRRDLITLTEPTTSRMRDYLASVHVMLKKV